VTASVHDGEAFSCTTNVNIGARWGGPKDMVETTKIGMIPPYQRTAKKITMTACMEVFLAVL
jgi:hypothetical protein